VLNVDPETVMTAPDVADVIHPNIDLISAFDVGYTQHKRLYPAMKALL